MTREEEINMLAQRIVNSEKITTMQGAVEYVLKHAEEHLKNPWISVEDRLPEKGDMVFTRSVLIIKGGGERSEDEQFLAQKFVGYWATDSCRQHRMHGLMYDTINKVTHWMPIPQLSHDDMLINGLKEMNEHFKKGEYNYGRD